MGVIQTSTGAAGRRHKARRRHLPMAEINVTPFVDVMLVLLIVFMVAAPLLTVGIPVDLPQTQGETLGTDTVRGSLSPWMGLARVSGSSIGTPTVSSGAVTMKTMSSTSITSTKGVTLISLIGT